MNLKKIKNHKWKVDFWTIFFSMISLIFANFALFIPEQRILFIVFFISSIILALVFFYSQKINYNEASIKILNNNILELSHQLTEKFNYWKDLTNLKLEVEMLKKRGKRAQINLLDIIKIIIAVILVYVIVETIRSLPK